MMPIYRYKNMIQQIGKFIMAEIFKENYANPLNVITYLNQEAPGLLYEIEWRRAISFEDFKFWLDSTGLRTTYKKIKVFREVWLYNDGEWRNRHYKWVLTKITTKFLKNYAYRTFLNKTRSRRFFAVNIEASLENIPRLLRALEDPENFFSLHAYQ